MQKEIPNKNRFCCHHGDSFPPIFEANPCFGRQRIANILWLLGVFVAASTVRNALLPPKPRNAPAAAKAEDALATPLEIVVRYPSTAPSSHGPVLPHAWTEKK